MALADVIKAAMDQIQYVAKTETVIGEPITAGEVTLIPVSRVSIGFAAGGGGKEDKYGSGAATGGGINIIPVAFITICGEKVEVLPVTGEEPVLSKIISSAPDVLKKISKYIKKKDEMKSDKTTDSKDSD
jgi:uncharacterized spore protein YtfJ